MSVTWGPNSNSIPALIPSDPGTLLEVTNTPHPFDSFTYCHQIRSPQDTDWTYALLTWLLSAASGSTGTGVAIVAKGARRKTTKTAKWRAETAKCIIPSVTERATAPNGSSIGGSSNKGHWYTPEAALRPKSSLHGEGAPWWHEYHMPTPRPQQPRTRLGKYRNHSLAEAAPIVTYWWPSRWTIRRHCEGSL